MIDFAQVADELAGHAKTITEMRAKILTANNTVREGGRGDLVAPDPVRSLVEIAERHVHDSVKGLVIPEFYPRRAEGGPALLRLTK